MKLSDKIVTAKYLKISDSNYKNFLTTMPLAPEGSVTNQLVGNEFQYSELFYSFKFLNIDYEIYLRTGKWCIETHERYLNFPLPHGIDETVKNVLIKTIGQPLPVGACGDIPEPELGDFLSTLQSNAKITDHHFSRRSIQHSLLRIQNAQHYIRRKGLIRWYPIPHPCHIITPPITFDEYKNLHYSTKKNDHSQSSDSDYVS